MVVALYYTGAVFPLSLVWIVNPMRRDKGLKILYLWLGIVISDMLIFLLLGLAFHMVGGLSMSFQDATIKTIANLVLAIVALAGATFAPMSLARFAPVGPGAPVTSGPSMLSSGFGGSSGGGSRTSDISSSNDSSSNSDSSDSDSGSGGGGSMMPSGSPGGLANRLMQSLGGGEGSSGPSGTSGMQAPEGAEGMDAAGGGGGVPGMGAGGTGGGDGATGSLSAGGSGGAEGLAAASEGAAEAGLASSEVTGPIGLAVAAVAGTVAAGAKVAEWAQQGSDIMQDRTDDVQEGQGQ